MIRARLKPFFAGLAPGLLWLPTYLGLQEVIDLSPWTAMLVSSSAGIAYIQLSAIAFGRPLRIPLCLASSILLLLASYVASAIAFLTVEGGAADTTLVAAVGLALAASFYGFSIIFTQPHKK